jgi:prevent-host-death family protein
MWHNISVRTMSIRELRDSLSFIGEIADREGEVVLTRHGRPLARLVSLCPSRTAPSHSDLRAGMPYLSISSEQLVRADRDGVAG